MSAAKRLDQNTIARGMMKQKEANRNYRRQFEFDFESFIEDHDEEFFSYLTYTVACCNCPGCKEEHRAVYGSASEEDEEEIDTNTEEEGEGKKESESESEDDYDPDDPDLARILGLKLSGKG